MAGTGTKKWWFLQLDDGSFDVIFIGHDYELTLANGNTLAVRAERVRVVGELGRYDSVVEFSPVSGPPPTLGVVKVTAVRFLS